MVKFLSGTVIALAVAFALTLRYSATLNGEKTRLLANQSALIEQQREYKFRDSLNAVSVRVLTMNAEELRRGLEHLNALVRDMDVKLKRVQNVSQTALEGRYGVTAAVRDTVISGISEIVRDTLRHAQTIRFSDLHMCLEGVIVDSMFYGSVTTRDTLTQVVHRIPRRFLFIRWGTKELRQEIVTSNPHTHIIYNRSIRVL